MDVYTEAQTLIKEALAEYGQDVTLIKSNVSSFDPVEGVVSETEIQHTFRGITQSIESNLVDGSSIKVGDRELILEISDEDPELFNQALISGQKFTIVPPLETVNPAGTPLFHRAIIRK